MNIGKESTAFVAEPLPEPIEVPVADEADEREEVLVPVAVETAHVTASA